MDLLKQYEKQSGGNAPVPEVKVKTNPASQVRWVPDSQEGFLMRTAVMLSGGRIQNEDEAQKALLIAAGIIFLAALVVFVYGANIF